jgi:SAM-dependent methyltransferase
MSDTASVLPRGELADRYSADAPIYNEIWSPVILPAAQSLVRALGLGGARRVLDVGAGAGALTPTICTSAQAASVTALDASEGILRIAHTRHGVPAGVGDAVALPVQAESVDAVILAFVLFHLTSPHLALQEAARVVRPEGRIGTVTWRGERPERAGMLWDAALDAAGAPPAQARGQHRGLDSPTAMRRHLERVGLTVDGAWTQSIDHTFTVDEFWRLRTGAGNPRWRLDQLAPDLRERLLRELRRSTATLPPEDFRFRGTVVLAVATRPSYPVRQSSS